MVQISWNFFLFFFWNNIQLNIMLDIQQKRKLRFFVYHRFTLGALFIFVLVMTHSTYQVYKKKQESEGLLRVSEDRVDLLRKRDTDLNEKINRLDTDVGIEEEIRSKFSVTKENENMVVVVPKDEKVATSVPESSSLWSKFISFFK